MSAMESSAPIPIRAPAGHPSTIHNLPPLVMKPGKTPAGELRRGHLQMDTYSPVQQNGSFLFDRVIKSGQVLKRTRKTKSWKPVFLVLRPNLLSIYKDVEATKLRHQLAASDLTAVARQKDPKHKAQHVFGIFSPARNFHIEAKSERDAQEWVELIRQEARIDELEEDDMSVLSSPTRHTADIANKIFKHTSHDRTNTFSSSSEPEGTTSRLAFRHRNRHEPGKRMHSATRRPSRALHEYSGNEAGSFSDFSDTGFFPGRSTTSLNSYPNPAIPEAAADAPLPADPAAPSQQPPSRPGVTRTASGVSLTGVSATGLGTSTSPPTTDERVIYHGHLYMLKSKNGIRSWKTFWCVLRPRQLAMYKDESEYSALFLLPFAGIIDAVELDAQSRTKTHCFQLITEERNYRLCAMSENELAKWLGAFKSLLAKRKEKAGGREGEGERERAEGTAVSTATATAAGAGAHSGVPATGMENRNVSVSSEATRPGGTVHAGL